MLTVSHPFHQIVKFLPFQHFNLGSSFDCCINEMVMPLTGMKAAMHIYSEFQSHLVPCSIVCLSTQAFQPNRIPMNGWAALKREQLYTVRRVFSRSRDYEIRAFPFLNTLHKGETSKAMELLTLRSNTVPHAGNFNDGGYWFVSGFQSTDYVVLVAKAG